MTFVERRPAPGRRGRGVPHRLHRRARLRADRRRRVRAGAVGRAAGRRRRPTGIAPCGLGARDTLRTEMGYPLHGQDITRDVTPNQARAGLGGGLEEGRRSGAARRCWPRRRPARAGCCAAASPPAAASRARTWRCRLTRRRPGRRGHLRHLLADPASRGRPGAAVHAWWPRTPRSPSTSAAAARSSSSCQPPFVDASVKEESPVNLPDQPATFRQPTPAERPWWWRLEDAEGSPRSRSPSDLRRPAVRHPGRRRVLGRGDLGGPGRGGRRRGDPARARPRGLRPDVAAALTSLTVLARC